MKRTLILDDDDLVMVIGKDVVKQIDDNRGEMNRTEFVSVLIQCQLKECSAHHDYVEKEEFEHFIRGMKGLFRNFLELVISMEMKRQPQADGFREWCYKLQALSSYDSKDEEL